MEYSLFYFLKKEVKMKKIMIYIIVTFAFMSITSVTIAAKVTIYGKGVTEIIVNPDGSTTVKLCPESSTAACAIISTVSGSSVACIIPTLEYEKIIEGELIDFAVNGDVSWQNKTVILKNIIAK
jgi:hypothetical protein